MGYFPTSQNDPCHYANSGWEYQQGMIEYEHFPETQNESYFDESDNYSCCGWECQNQKDFNAPHSTYQEPSSLDFTVNAFMQDCSSGLQNDSYKDEFNNYSSCDWEGQNQRALNVSYSTYQEPSTLKHTFNSFMQNCPTLPPSFSFENSSLLDYASTKSFLQNPYNSFHQPQNSLHYTENSFQHPQNLFHNPQNSFHTPQNNFTTTYPCPQNYSQPSSLELAVEDHLQKSRESLERTRESLERQEILCKKMDEHLEQIRRNLGLPSIEDED
ncbi:hypothetical protein AHAS_Ahas16G0195000 [Arachis hypogaea]